MSEKTSLEEDVARLIIDTLNLEIKPDEISPEEALFVEGLGLDSIDALEIALGVSKQYGVKLSTDNSDVASVFSSLRSLTAYIEEHSDK